MFAAVPYASADAWPECRSRHLEANRVTSRSQRCPPDSTCASPIDHSCARMLQSSLVAGLRSSLLNIRRLTGVSLGLNKEIDRERCSTKARTHAQGRSQRCRMAARGVRSKLRKQQSWTSNPDRNGRVRNRRKQRNIRAIHAYKHGGAHTHIYE